MEKGKLKTANAEVEVVDELSIAWDNFLAGLRQAKKAWTKISSSRHDIRVEDSPGLSTFARRCLSVYRRQKFEKMLPDFIKYSITAGGLKNNK